MTTSEVQAMWQERIATFKASGQSNVAAWCRENDIRVKSMYNWLGKERGMESKSPPPQTWLPIDIPETSTTISPSLTVKIGTASIEITADFDPSVFEKVVQVLQRHAE